MEKQEKFFFAFSCVCTRANNDLASDWPLLIYLGRVINPNMRDYDGAPAPHRYLVFVFFCSIIIIECALELAIWSN